MDSVYVTLLCHGYLIIFFEFRQSLGFLGCNTRFVGHLCVDDSHNLVLVFKGNIWLANDNCVWITFQRSDSTGQICLLLQCLTKLAPMCITEKCLPLENKVIVIQFANYSLCHICTIPCSPIHEMTFVRITWRSYIYNIKKYDLVVQKVEKVRLQYTRFYV